MQAKHRRGKRGRFSRYSNEDIAKMRAEWKSGLKYREIAERWQCSVPTVCDFILYGIKGRPRSGRRTSLG